MKEKMNSREKFHAVMNFDTTASNMKTEFGYWAGCIRHWFAEGLPKTEDIPTEALDGEIVRGSSPIRARSNELVDKNVMNCLCLDSYLAKFPFDISPRKKNEVLKEDNHYKIFKDRYGVTKKIIKDNAATHLTIDYPIKTSDDFHHYIELYEEDFETRLPEDFEKLQIHLKNRDFPIRLGGAPFGFTFLPRHLMGDVGYMMCMHDNPQLIKDINEFFLDFVMKYWSLILKQVDIDCIMILEDVAYKNGPMISPAMFKEFVTPYCRRLVDFVRQYGISNIYVDCDGLIDELIPLWVETGVTGIFPVEAVNDIVAIRQAHPKLKMMAGIDKTKLFTNNRSLIDKELRRIEPIIRTGGYVPHIDHAVSQDISWHSFRYYRERLNNIIDEISS